MILHKASRLPSAVSAYSSSDTHENKVMAYSRRRGKMVDGNGLCMGNGIIRDDKDR